MKTIIINNIEEMQKYYNKNTNTYEFIEDGLFLDVEFTSKIDVMSNIKACDINARDINARDINARDIKACDINAWDINARDIKACDIKARDINAWDINARDINASDIKARDINAWDINARDINASDINYYAVCFAYGDIVCDNIIGNRENSRHFVLDGELRIKKEEEV